MRSRKINTGLIHLRRSGASQETSLEKQLNWALNKAEELGVKIDGTTADLAHMQDNGLCVYKGLHLDDAKQGDDLDRQGLTSIVARAENDKSVSHIFAFKRDRLARPQNPAEMTATEGRLSHSGVTIVFSDRVLTPAVGGRLDIADQFISLLEYNKGYEFLIDHAQQMIHTQVELASQGFSLGGRPPYGFMRALYNQSTGELEYLPDGRTVKAKGCHVVWVPGNTPEHKEKLETWLMMLKWKKKGWGNQKIANRLNELGIPSPDAGKTRSKNGVKYVVDGTWSQGTVRNLLANRLIAGKFEVGKTSEGKHRRTGANGPRDLDEDDYTSTGKLKKIRNPRALVTTGPVQFDPLIDPDELDEIQKQIAERDCRQVGVPRCKDPAKYPLACRLIDLNCGSLMYGRENGGRLLYVCSRYMRTNGAECENNNVDAEAMLKFLMSTLSDEVEHLDCREVLEQKIRALAEVEAAAIDTEEDDKALANARVRVGDLQQQIDTAAKNLLLETNEKIKDRMRCQFKKLEQEMVEAEAALTDATESRMCQRTVEEEVAVAMNLFDDLKRVTKDPDARADIQPLLVDMGLNVGLNFVEAIKGKKRKVRKLASGVIVFDNKLLDPEPDCGDGRHGREDSPVDRTETTPTSASRSTKRHPEGVSFTKGNRGGQI